jgi:hypothetical protein
MSPVIDGYRKPPEFRALKYTSNLKFTWFDNVLHANQT